MAEQPDTLPAVFSGEPPSLDDPTVKEAIAQETAEYAARSKSLAEFDSDPGKAPNYFLSFAPPRRKVGEIRPMRKTLWSVAAFNAGDGSVTIAEVGVPAVLTIAGPDLIYAFFMAFNDSYTGDDDFQIRTEHATFEWFKDGVSFGVTQPYLTRSSTSPGDYHVIITTSSDEYEIHCIIN